MAITPKQNIVLNHFDLKIFDFDNISNKNYISRQANNLLKIFGNDCIIDGMEILGLEYVGQNTINVSINSGKIIIDQILIEFLEITNLSIDVTDYCSETGFLIISIGYNYLDNKYDNKSLFKFIYVSDQNNIKNFFISFDKIILSKIVFNKQERTCHVDNIDNLTLYDKKYIISEQNLISKKLQEKIDYFNI